MGSGVEIPTAERDAVQSVPCTTHVRTEGLTVSLVDLGRVWHRRTLVLELVLLRLGRRPEHGVVDGRDLDVLDNAAERRERHACETLLERKVASNGKPYVAQAGRRSMRSPEGMVMEICRSGASSSAQARFPSHSDD